MRHSGEEMAAAPDRMVPRPKRARGEHALTRIARILSVKPRRET